MLLKAAPAGVRAHTVAAAAGFSAALAAVCLASAWISGRPGPIIGFCACAAAAVALIRGCRHSAKRDAWRCAPGGIIRSGGDAGQEGVFFPISVTGALICLTDPAGAERLAVWRDETGSDQFRRMAAFGLWRRRGGRGHAQSTELIVRKPVTGLTVPRAERPRDS